LNKRAAVAVAVVVGLIAIAVPIAASIYIAWKLSFDQQMSVASALAKEILRRAEQSTDQTFVIFRRLQAARAADPCSDQNIRLMASLDLASDQVQAIGYVRDDTLLCSSYGRLNTPIGRPTYVTPYGTEVRSSIEFPVLPGVKFLLVTETKTGYSAAIHHGRALDVFLDDPGISVGVFSIASGKPVLSRGKLKEQWLGALGKATDARLVDDDRLVALQKSDKYALVGFAAIPAATVNEGLRRTALVLVPLGIAGGLLLGFAVLYLARQQLALPAVLKVALKRNEFFLLYQPIIELRGGRCVGAEALIRWKRPNGEMVRPDVFIPVAEETGLIHEVTKRVMDIVARDAVHLLKARPGFHIGINLSHIDLELHDTPALVKALIERMGVEPHNILVEATERGFMQFEKARKVMGEIRALKLKIAIDDFGTGYSSLSYLEKFPLDFLKIDKSFVDTMGGKAATSQVAVHIIEMARSLKLEMIAEGVETEAQLKFLQEHGVQFAQGWLFGKPMPLRDLAVFVAKLEKTVAQ
jgi:sensor c-di-GMP phosphodiesterase-like protein